MKGIIIWSQSNCRSTMALYRELIRVLNVPAVITLWHYNKTENYKDIREQIGFSHDEFSDLPIEPVGEDLRKGMCILDSHLHWHHIFCVWQGSPVYRQLIVEAKRRGCPVAIMCESPCNMASGWRRLAKSCYMHLVLPWVARHVVKNADIFINDSGDDKTFALLIGWSKEKIIPFGYFPPPIPGSKCVLRNTNAHFSILASGLLTKYRGGDVLVEALRILKDRGITYHATITQKGELFETLKRKITTLDLPIDLPGFVKMEELIHLYETCSVYVGAGRNEPWGMRLNDALQCGAPLIVSRGMGGVQLVDHFHCGFDFPAGNAGCLADALEKLATNEALYKQIAWNAVEASHKISPAYKALELIDKLKGWL